MSVDELLRAIERRLHVIDVSLIIIIVLLGGILGLLWESYEDHHPSLRLLRR